jgi:hypothetical protein
MAKKKQKVKDPNSNVQPITNPLNAVVKDFKAHMKATDRKLKDMTYDQVLEALVDHCQDLLSKQAHAGPTA